MARSIANTYAPAPCSPPSLTAVACPVPPITISEDSQAGLTQDDSPPDIQEHTISTPIQSDQLPKAPQFDLSKVAQPPFNVTTKDDIPPLQTFIEVKPSKQTSISSFSSSILRLQNNYSENPTKSDLELCKLPQDFQPNQNYHSKGTGLVPPPPPLRKSSVSTYPATCKVSQRPLPPPKPVRTSSTSTFTQSPTPERHNSNSVAQLPRDTYSSIPAPPHPPSGYSSLSILVHHPSTAAQVIVEDASDCDSSTWGSIHSTTPIVSSAISSRTPCKAWPTSPAPTRLQLSTTTASAGSSGLLFSDIHEISRKARKISTSSNVDWSKLP
eukprot:GFUD01027758.1.p1 GENE.GFUD01027758.1~~GFUD01027758.1.p1  ORF type:complete len:364 (+),score=73.74 GFUD01027758.1:115-1092(+)